MTDPLAVAIVSLLVGLLYLLVLGLERLGRWALSRLARRS